MMKVGKKQKALMDFADEEIQYEFNIYCRELNKDMSNLMECLRKQEKDNKGIIYVGRNFKKVILPYEEYYKMCQKLDRVEKLMQLPLDERIKIGLEYLKWCIENNAIYYEETNMVTWAFCVKLKEMLKNV